MSIEITARHMQVDDDVQEYVRGKADALQAEFPRIEHIHVILSEEKRWRKAEVVLQAKNHIRIGLTESSENMRISIDVVMDKVEKQLRKQRDKIQDHKPSRKAAEQEKKRGATS